MQTLKLNELVDRFARLERSHKQSLAKQVVGRLLCVRAELLALLEGDARRKLAFTDFCKLSNFHVNMFTSHLEYQYPTL